jgi:hypothetical protein
MTAQDPAADEMSRSDNPGEQPVRLEGQSGEALADPAVGVGPGMQVVREG